MIKRAVLLLCLVALLAAVWVAIGPGVQVHYPVPPQAPYKPPEPNRPDTRLTLSAQVKKGAVHLRWTGAAAARVRLVRSTSDLSGGVQPVRYPVTLLEVRGSAYKDTRVGDGVRYHYQVQAGERWSNVVTVDIAPRRLRVTGSPSLRVDKASYLLEVYDGDRVVKRYPIALGRNPVRRKLHQDNASTPEGSYRITNLQPDATFYKAYDINYPNDTDIARYDAALEAGQLGEVPPGIGGEVQLHGQGIASNWTYGCIALRNEDMDELFGCAAIAAGTPVVIFRAGGGAR